MLDDKKLGSKAHKLLILSNSVILTLAGIRVLEAVKIQIARLHLQSFILSKKSFETMGLWSQNLCF